MKFIGYDDRGRWHENAVAMLITLILTLFYSKAVLATDTGGISTDDLAIITVMCNVVNLVTGTAGRILFTLVIVVVSGSAMFGKLAPVVAITVVAFSAFMLGAPQFATWLASSVSDSDTGYECDSGA